jgi:hypothetical protein
MCRRRSEHETSATGEIVKCEQNICEQTRLLLDEFVCQLPKLVELNDDQVLAIEDAFLRAAKHTSGMYRANALDRRADFLILVETAKEWSGLSLDTVLRWVHIKARVTRREFDRESLAPEDEFLGVDELRKVSENFRSVVQSETVKQYIEPASRYIEKWQRISEQSERLVEVTRVQIYDKKQLKKEGRMALEQATRELLEMAAAAGLPQKKCAVNWYTELLAAGRGYYGGESPVRPSSFFETWKLYVPNGTAIDYERRTFAPAQRKRLISSVERIMNPLEHRRSPKEFQDEYMPVLSAREKEVLKCELELQREYGGQYVAFRDRWQKSGDAIELDREVLVHAASYADAVDRLEIWIKEHPEVDRNTIVDTFVHQPGSIPVSW